MKTSLLLLLPLALSACTQAPSDESPPPAIATPANVEATAASTHADTLPRYFWRLGNATDAQGKRIDALFVQADKPVQLQFADGRLQISNTCNAMGGGYRISDGQLQIGPLASTQRACIEPGLMALDQAVGDRLQGRLAYTLDSDGLQLSLTTAGGDTLVFAGEPTPETRYGGPGETVFLEVDSETRPCSHPLVPDKQCLQVREVRFDDAGRMTVVSEQWQNAFEGIQGFEHQPGLRNVVRVKRYQRNPAPADASTQVDVLDMVVRSEVVKR